MSRWNDVDPFESQEPWVYQTASLDRPAMALERDDASALGRARNLLEGPATAAASELAGLDRDHPQASAALRAAEEIARSGAEPWRVHLWCAQLAYARGRAEECARRLEQVERSDPDAPARTHLVARLARRRGDHERARRLAGRLLERRPESARAHAELGHVALERGREEEGRRHLAQAVSLAGGDELLLRELNQAASELLVTAATLREVRLPGRCAVLVPGHLRRMDTSLAFLKEIARHVDLFVCTNASYREAAEQLAAEAGATCRIVEDDPADRAREDAAPVGSMKQWFKLKLCLEMMLARERRDGLRYRDVYKLRTDYHLLDAGGFLDLAADEDTRALLARSDKVFGGPRELMLPLAGLFHAMGGLFLDRERAWWPVQVEQILRSSDSYKWFGMNLPRRVVGDCRTVLRLRERVAAGREALEAWRPGRFDRYTRLFRGHPRMASEICFARYLNLLGTPVAESPRLAGFLLADRRERGAPA